MNKYIKMIGMDLDGTLLTTDKKITDYTKSVLTKAIEQGCMVLVATGRPFEAIPKMLREFPGMRYAVTANGARIIDVEEGITIHESLLPIETTEQVLDVFADYNALYEVFINGKGYTKAESMGHLEDYFKPNMVRYMQQTRTPVENFKETLSKYNLPVDKAQGVFCDEEERQQAEKRLECIPGIVVTSALGNNLEVNREGTSKGLALLKLGEMFGIRREEIMAFGDGMNDYEMLGTVGFGVAMENGVDQVKKVADYITGTNDEDGVAKAIERFVLV